MKKNLLIGLICAAGWFGLAANVPFTLQNKALHSIYLEIPGVMNPNLSPLSRSGVSLEVGQKIYFRKNGENYLLLEVTEDLRNQTVVVNRLLRQRKRAMERQ